MRLRSRGSRIAAATVAGMLVLSGCGGGGGDEGSGDDISADASASPEPSEDEGKDGEQTGEITVRGCEPQNPLIPTNTSETCGGNILDQVLAKLVKYDSDDGHAEMDIA